MQVIPARGLKRGPTRGIDLAIDRCNAGNSREGFETKEVRMDSHCQYTRCNAGNSREGFETHTCRMIVVDNDQVAMQVIPARGLGNDR